MPTLLADTLLARRNKQQILGWYILIWSMSRGLIHICQGQVQSEIELAKAMKALIINKRS
jgi:hypothetical protein